MGNARLVPIVIAAIAAAASAPGAPLAPAMPGPSTPARIARLHGDAPAQNAACEGCHAEIAAEHRGSFHRRSQDDPAYQRAFAVEPLPFCQRCHAPEADAFLPVPPPLAALGTGCVTCHVTGDGAILAAPRARDAQRRIAPHAVLRDARFGAEGACVGCHDFAFPDGVARRHSEPMQATVAEHRASPWASFSCAACHMERAADGHRRHDFAASRSPARIRAAATASAARLGPGTLRVHLVVGDVGHAFPTGDLFRRLTVSAEVEGDDHAVIAHAERHLARHFGEARLGLAGARTQVSDDRLGVGGPERDVDLALGPEAEGLPIAWRVAYERVEHPLSRDGEQALVEGSIVVAEGSAPP